MHIYCSDVRSHSAAPESNKQNPRDRTLDLPIFFRYKHITSLKNLPSPAPNESLPYWFQGNFAASFVLKFCLREFLLSAFANRFELRCEPKQLMLLYYKSALVVLRIFRNGKVSKPQFLSLKCPVSVSKEESKLYTPILSSFTHPSHLSFDDINAQRIC